MWHKNLSNMYGGPLGSSLHSHALLDTGACSIYMFACSNSIPRALFAVRVLQFPFRVLYLQFGCSNFHSVCSIFSFACTICSSQALISIPRALFAVCTLYFHFRALFAVRVLYFQFHALHLQFVRCNFDSTCSICSSHALFSLLRALFSVSRALFAVRTLFSACSICSSHALVSFSRAPVATRSF